MTVIARELLEAMGGASLGEALQQLPWQSNAINTQFNNGGDGTTRIALRGLGAARTLVLINGRRHVHGGRGGNESVDLNAIPLALVERVEIMRGPTTVHGSGAIGGVVNIVTRDVEGVEAALFTGSTADGLGVAYDLSMAMGQRFERGHVVAVAGYYDQEAISAGARDFSRDDRFYDWETGEVTSRGSTAVPEGYIRDHGEDVGNEAWNSLVTAANGARVFFNAPGTGWRPFRGTGNSDEGDYYNDQPENYLVTPQRRYHAFAAGDYQLGNHVRAFFEASYLNRRSEQRLAPTPLVTASEGITVSADNAYNPFDRDFIDVHRRMVEAGPRRFLQDVDTMRLVAGLGGALPADLGTLGTWGWELAYGYGATESTDRALGGLRRDRLAAALGPSFTDAGGNARCGTPDAPGDPACVPLDLFGGAGSITPEMLGYVGHNAVGQGFTRQHVLTLRAGGDLARAPSGAGAALRIGLEYRDESGGRTPDPLLADTT